VTDVQIGTPRAAYVVAETKRTVATVLGKTEKSIALDAYSN
jgi:hypothetical protein